ncbi:hypothetical protein SAPIO_CDS2479 [Scedosporium apiospermum]|uniref:Hsp70 family chaperone n=1 Tax=Pseudallescheria apiosperma TaxID=563466 RepID=A0A084GCJ5_PSEDA|nr:uncharacterized protein SAPIO_CDS2479 [Scedosporium apiospermum]KEZ45057.1 hypothetical protein SAPIO_CDS2479 [Scedosporium apiospermum]
MGPPGYSTERKEAEGDTLVIALDFGTTFSGIAYAFSTDPEEIYPITNWPGGEDRIAPKTPTAIRYGRSLDVKWGYQLDLTLSDNIMGLKLLLDPEQKRPYYIPTDIKAEMAKLPKSVLDVAADYMKAIFSHALQEIVSDAIDPSFVACYHKKFMLTVPAVWSDKAKDLTLRAGDAIVICDAGGGTVDLVSYEILSLDPFELKALTAPSGGICGSMMVNKLFEEEIKKVVGDSAYAELKKTPAYRCALRDFDGAIKPAFRGRNDPDRFVSFPMAGLEDNPARGLLSNSMTLSGDTMFRIFDPIAREIEKLVSEQVSSVRMERLQLKSKTKSAVKAIFLVGGFGSSAYLKQVIEKSNPGILVIQPREAWSAIVRGAVMSKLGIAPVVKTTKAPKHYGSSANSTWNSSRDRGHLKIWDKWAEVEKCKTMSWFIYRGEDLVRGKKIKLPFYRSLGGSYPRGRELQFVDHLYECNALLAPAHPNGDLSAAPRTCFTTKQRPSDGEFYTEIHYHLVIENDSSGLMKFSLEVDGKECGTVNAKY